MSAIKTKKDMKTAEEFLIERNIIIEGATSFPLNLTRDTHMKSKRDIVQAMDEYADYKHSFLSNVRLSSLTDEMLDKWVSEADLCELGDYANGREHGAEWLADRIKAFRDEA